MIKMVNILISKILIKITHIIKLMEHHKIFYKFLKIYKNIFMEIKMQFYLHLIILIFLIKNQLGVMTIWLIKVLWKKEILELNTNG